MLIDKSKAQLSICQCTDHQMVGRYHQRRLFENSAKMKQHSKEMSDSCSSSLGYSELFQSGMGFHSFDSTEMERLLRTTLSVSGSENMCNRCHFNTTFRSTSTVHFNVADFTGINTSVIILVYFIGNVKLAFTVFNIPPNWILEALGVKGTIVPIELESNLWYSVRNVSLSFSRFGAWSSASFHVLRCISSELGLGRLEPS